MQMWKAFKLPPLGDRRPSELLADILKHLGGKPFDEFHLQLFISKLPNFMQHKYGGKSLAEIGHVLPFAVALDDKNAVGQRKPTIIQNGFRSQAWRLGKEQR